MKQIAYVQTTCRKCGRIFQKPVEIDGREYRSCNCLTCQSKADKKPEKNPGWFYGGAVVWNHDQMEDDSPWRENAVRDLEEAGNLE